MHLYSCFGVCLILLSCPPVITEQSNLVCSSQPVVALVGSDAVLPCRLDPPISASSRAVEWTKPGLDPGYIHVHQDGRLAYQSQNLLYKYRTALFADQLVNGNVSLKLLRVKTSDAGKYKCFLPSLWKDAFIQLDVGAASQPIVSLAGVDKATKGVILQCNSTGWYPEPEVSWLDGEGKRLSAGPPETVRGPDDLYTVSSRVTVEKRHGRRFTCRVTQKKTDQTRETTIQVPEEFFITPPSCTIGIVVSVLVCLTVPAVLFAVWRWRQNKKDSEKLEIEDEAEKNQEKKPEGETKDKAENNKKQSREAPSGTNRDKESKPERQPLIKTHTSSNQDNQDKEPSKEVIIEEVDLDGKFLRLKNMTKLGKQMRNWRISVLVNKDEIEYKFTEVYLEGGNTVTIWASDGGRSNNPPTDLVWKDQESWGTAEKVTLQTAMGELMDVKTDIRPQS